jgi:hypothetical protein
MATNNNINYAPVTVGYVSNRWYPAGNLNALDVNPTTITATAGQLIYVPFIVPFAAIFKAIGIWVTTGIAASTTNFGIYNSDSFNSNLTGNALPVGNPIVTSGNIATATSGAAASFTFGSPITLGAGVYWLAIASSSSSIVYQSTNNSTFYGPNIQLRTSTLTNPQTSAGYGCSQAFVYSATLPSASVSTYLTNSNTQHAIMLQAS